ncbi:MAG: SNF2-related protein [Bacteroidia bacterium]
MLYPHQVIAKDFLLKNQRVILADAPRCGKTLPTAAAALANLPALIVCPAIVKNVWKDAIEAIAPGTPITVINGKKSAENIGGDGITIINYDLLGAIKGIKPFSTLVLDESHRIKNHKAIRTKAALKLMSRIPRVYALSGTPIPNRPIELWPLLHGLGIYGGGGFDFAQVYAIMYTAPWGLDVSGASNLPELRELMRPYTLRRTRDQVFTDYQQPITSLITFDLPIDKREQEFNADALINHPSPMLAFEGLAEVMKEAGIRKVKPSIEFIENILESGESVVVFVHHHVVAHALKDELKKRWGTSVITGETSPKYRQEILNDFQSGKNKLFIGNLAACQEGIDLSIADTVIFVEATWQTSALEQASARVENINKQGKAPLIYLLTIANSLDHTILKKILKKQNIINQII